MKPNPFTPPNAMLEQQSKRRSHMKLGVFCVLAVTVTGLMAMLIQGCKRQSEEPAADNSEMTNMETTVDTNVAPMVEESNPPVVVPPVTQPSPVVTVPPVETQPIAAAGTEYVVVRGDTLGKIAKAHGVSVKALEAANPNVVPTKLKVGQKLTIPAGGTSTSSATSTAAPMDNSMGGEVTYTVKSGDTLTKIAKAKGVTVKAIEAANNLPSTKIYVGQKLKIPAGAAPAASTMSAPAQPVPVPTPVVTPPTQSDTSSAPVGQ
ncbi:MAG TPA: LysM peptidoglycan-binding domain-containing protein [Verrucomicrobiae bacterium]|nr:LysM peptidoglycan-binding domain-containing protein [Verrucomicrobiae bacterium]